MGGAHCFIPNSMIIREKQYKNFKTITCNIPKHCKGISKENIVHRAKDRKQTNKKKKTNGKV